MHLVCLCRFGTGRQWGDVQLGVQQHRIAEDLRQARDFESAHLEAVLKDSGAKALRLARLRDVFEARGVSAKLDLRLIPGAEPQLWLDFTHCLVMRPDARTYQLNRHERDRIETVLETQNIDDAVAAGVRASAHASVQAARSTDLPSSDSTHAAHSVNTLVYIWMTGLLTGAAIFALALILLKKINF